MLEIPSLMLFWLLLPDCFTPSLGGYKIKQDYYRLGEAKASGNLGNTLKVIGKMTFREFPLTMVSPRLTRQDICMDVVYMYIYVHMYAYSSLVPHITR